VAFFISGDCMKKPTTKAGKQAKVSKVMKEYGKGQLHSGKGGKVVKSPKQAIAIALSEAGMSKKKGK
jgi:ribosomal protein L21E